MPDWSSLERAIDGGVGLPGSGSYEARRRPFNARFDEVRPEAEHQPFTPIIETLRGLLLGTAIGDSAVVAIAWCIGITVISYRWALKLYNRPRSG